MRHTRPRARTSARFESLESRQLLSLVPVAPAPSSTTSPDCGCGSGDSHTVYVDDDHRQCPNAMFTSIQAAVLYAEANPMIDTVRVCPGVYNETVTVNKTLRILGPASDCGACQNRTPDPNRDAIVQFVNPAGGIFNLEANDIELDGFVVRGNTVGTGIYTVPTFSGYLVEHNLVTQNVFGLYFNASGLYESVARRNCFIDNTVPGAANGNGVYSDQGLRNAVITENRFEKQFNASVIMAGLPGTQSDITITCNQAINDSTIVLFNVDHGVVARNLSYNSDGSGIFIGGGNNRVDVEYNAVLRASSAGIATNDPIGYGLNTNIDIDHNLVAENGTYGISLRQVTDSRIDSNYVVKNGRLVANPNDADDESGGDGIRIGVGATYNCVTRNSVERNNRDGIRAEKGSANNEIAYNRMRYNRFHDAHDDTVGPYNPPAMVANHWHDNDCRTQNRPGLCDNCGCECRTGQEQGIPDEDKEAYRTSVLSHEALVDQDTSVISFDEPLLGVLPDVLPGLWC